MDMAVDLRLTVLQAADGMFKEVTARKVIYLDDSIHVDVDADVDAEGELDADGEYEDVPANGMTGE